MRVDQETMRRLFDYDPSTGIVRWRYRADRTEHWNSRFAGSVAGVMQKTGYWRVSVGDRKHMYRSHIVWLYMTGERVPKHHRLDHINGSRDDDRWVNLRLATDAQNAWNSGRRSDNTSGHRGVSWDKSRGKWTVVVSVEGKQTTLGRFAKLDDAIAARAAFETKHYGAFAASRSHTTPGFPPSFICHVVRNVGDGGGGFVRRRD